MTCTAMSCLCSTIASCFNECYPLIHSTFIYCCPKTIAFSWVSFIILVSCLSTKMSRCILISDIPFSLCVGGVTIWCSSSTTSMPHWRPGLSQSTTLLLGSTTTSVQSDRNCDMLRELHTAPNSLSTGRFLWSSAAPWGPFTEPWKETATGYIFCSSSRLLHTDSVTDKFMGRMTEPKLPTNIPRWDLPNAFYKHLPSAWFMSCSSSIWTFAGMRMCFFGDLYLRTW